MRPHQLLSHSDEFFLHTLVSTGTGSVVRCPLFSSTFDLKWLRPLPHNRGPNSNGVESDRERWRKHKYGAHTHIRHYTCYSYTNCLAAQRISLSVSHELTTVNNASHAECTSQGTHTHTHAHVQTNNAENKNIFGFFVLCRPSGRHNTNQISTATPTMFSHIIHFGDPSKSSARATPGHIQPSNASGIERNLVHISLM